METEGERQHTVFLSGESGICFKSPIRQFK